MGEFELVIMIERDRRDVWWATPPLMKRKRAEPFGWTQIIDARSLLSRRDQGVCADVKSVFEIMKKQPKYLDTADLVRDVVNRGMRRPVYEGML